MATDIDVTTSEGRDKLHQLAKLAKELDDYDANFERLWARGLLRKGAMSSYLSLSGREDEEDVQGGQAA